MALFTESKRMSLSGASAPCLNSSDNSEFEFHNLAVADEVCIHRYFRLTRTHFVNRLTRHLLEGHQLQITMSHSGIPLIG